MDDGIAENHNDGRIPIGKGLAVALSALLFWLAAGGSIAAWLAGFSGTEGPPLLSFALSEATVFVPFLCMALGLWLSLRYIAFVPLRRFFTDAPSFRFGRTLKATAVTLLCYGAYEAIGYLRTPEAYRISDQIFWGLRIFACFASLILIPIQAGCEEALFRCLPARVAYGRLPKTMSGRLGLSAVSSILFVLPHLGNPEVFASGTPWAVIAYYAIFGFMSMELSVSTGGFETVLGIHTANNLFVAVVCGYPQSPLPGFPLLIKTYAIEGWSSSVQLAATFMIVRLVMRKPSSE